MSREHPQPDQLRWRTSTYSQGENDCVEVAPGRAGGGYWLRDTKNRNAGAHHFTTTQWAAFIQHVKNDDFH